MLGFISHADCLEHDAGPMHPDVPERLDAIGAYRTPTDFGHLYMLILDARWA